MLGCVLREGQKLQSKWRLFHFPRLQYRNTSGTYLERENTQNGCNILITRTLEWWRREGSNDAPLLIAHNLLKKRDAQNAITALCPIPMYKIMYNEIGRCGVAHRLRCYEDYCTCALASSALLGRRGGIEVMRLTKGERWTQVWTLGQLTLAVVLTGDSQLRGELSCELLEKIPE